jgi:hypothetical protein
MHDHEIGLDRISLHAFRPRRFMSPPAPPVPPCTAKKHRSKMGRKTESRIALNGLSAAGGRGLFCVAQYATALQNRFVYGNSRGTHGLSERDPKFQVAVRACDGRFTFEIFSVSGEPRTLQVGSQYYATPDDAERAGYAAIAAKGL